MCYANATGTARCLATYVLILLLCDQVAARSGSSCRLIPGDETWPSPADWQALNATVDGRLIATIPQASVCHITPHSNYDETACSALRQEWGVAQTFGLKPAEFMNAYYQNQSCDPFTDKSRPCDMGNYASYSIAVASVEDVVAGIQFARDKNIRLVVKNTGHDYNGKSTGTGALSLWMRNLKATEILTNYQSMAYTGPAIKLGAGVLVGEAYEAAAAESYRAVGGECGSVGISGGYSQGGGHSILNSKYGMGTDQVLEWEIVTARGEHLIATPEQNMDLYWALSGGGGGTFGVVLSMTTRIYEDGPFTAGSLGFTLEDAGNNATAFWTAIRLWFQRLPLLTDDGRTLQFVVFNNSFEAIAINLPDVDDSRAVETLLLPYTAQLDDLKITYHVNGNAFTSFLDYFNSTYGPLPYGTQPPDTILTSRLIPRSSVHVESVTPLIEAIHTTVSDGTFLFGCSAMTLPNISHPNNAVLPAWRDSIAICNVNAYWKYAEPLETNLNVKKILTEQYHPLIEAATPGSGVYLNEMDPWYTGDWKQNMYGVNYDKLLEIKHQNDPDYLFYGHFAVGGDEFAEDRDGRLCRIG